MRRPPWSRALSLWLLACAVAAPAKAETSVATDRKAPATPPPATPPEDVPIPWKVWRLFDPKLSYRSLGWAVGPSYLRTFGENELHRGIALARLETIEQRRSFYFLSIQRDLGIRIYSPWTFVPTFRYLYEGGVRLGPMELGAGVSLIPLTLDFTRGRFGFAGPSPGATARLGFTAGKLRISVRVERAYLWRWGGQRSQELPPTGKSLLEALRFWDWTAQPDSFMTGFALEITGEQPRSLRSGGHPVIFVK